MRVISSYLLWMKCVWIVHTTVFLKQMWGLLSRSLTWVEIWSYDTTEMPSTPANWHPNSLGKGGVGGWSRWCNDQVKVHTSTLITYCGGILTELCINECPEILMKWNNVVKMSRPNFCKTVWERDKLLNKTFTLSYCCSRRFSMLLNCILYSSPPTCLLNVGLGQGYQSGP